MFLESSGFIVYLALDMKSALELAPSTDFDVVLCDLNLPDGTGWDLLEQLRKKKTVEVRAIAFSAFDDTEHIARSRAAGFLGHLAKGVPPEELVAAIQNATVPNRTATQTSPSRKINSGARRPRQVQPSKGPTNRQSS